MITVSEFVQQLKILFPAVTFYNGAIDRKSKQCVGVYARGRGAPYKALGGIQNTSHSILPVTILVHWTESSDECEKKANAIFAALYEAEGLTIGGKRVISLTLLDSSPVDLFRDENNIAEMAIRINIIYER